MEDNLIHYALFTQFEELGKMTDNLDEVAGKAFLSYFCERAKEIKTDPSKKQDSDSIVHLGKFSEIMHKATEEYQLFMEAKKKEDSHDQR